MPDLIDGYGKDDGLKRNGIRITINFRQNDVSNAE